MRILFVSDVYFPRVNGVSTSIQTFAREFVAKRHQLTLIAPDYGQTDRDPFDIIRIPARRLPLDPEDRLLHARSIRRLTPRLAGAGFDLIHIQTPFVAHYAGIQLARRLHLPVIESYHTFFEEYLDKYVSFLPSRLLRLAARRLSRRQCNSVDALIVPSRPMLDVLQSYGVSTPAAVIPTGIALDRFTRGNGVRFRRRHGIPPDRPTLVHVGRLAHEKNIDFLLRVLARVKARHPSVLLVVAGEGPARGSLEILAHRLQLGHNILFVGYLERNGAVEDCYCAGDAFIFASRTETQGLVLLEAMALGVPVVSTAAMGTREVLREGRGCLIAGDDESDFADKVTRVLEDRRLRAVLSARAKRYAANWSAPLLAQDMLAFYDSVRRRGSITNR